MVKGTLEVFLVQGKGIKGPGIEFLDCLCPCGLNLWNPDKMHLYVVLQCGNQELTSSEAKKGGKYPYTSNVEVLFHFSVDVLKDLKPSAEGKKLIWNEKLILNLEYLEGKNEKYNKLVLRVMDKHKVSHNEFIGEATVYIKDILSLGEENGKAELGTQKYRVVLPDKTYSGEISVAVSFTLDV